MGQTRRHERQYLKMRELVFHKYFVFRHFGLIQMLMPSYVYPLRFKHTWQNFVEIITVCDKE